MRIDHGIESTNGLAASEADQAASQRRRSLYGGFFALSGASPPLLRTTPTQAGIRTVGVLLAAALAAASLTMPATAAEDTGTVTATVNVTPAPEVCLTLTSSTVIFTPMVYNTLEDPLDFGETGNASSSYAVGNCGAAAQDFYASATDAVSVEGSTWALANTPGVNQFAVTNFDQADNYPSQTPYLTKELAPVNTMSATHYYYAGHYLEMPTSGGGAGETMSFDIDWVAVLAE